MLELKLCDIYVAMLSSMFMAVNDDDAVCYGMGSLSQVEIEGTPLYLPTETKLDSKKHANDMFFHPLCENALFGQSKIIHFLTRRVLIALSFRTDAIVGDLLTLAGDGSKQSKIKNAKALEFLKIAKDIKENSLKSWGKVVTKMSEDNGVGIYSTYLNRNKEIDGTHYSRVCVLDVPMLRDTTAGADLCGVNVHSKANKELFRGIMEKLFEGVSLEYGSSHTVPYLHSMLTMYRAVSDRLNDVIQMFKGAIDVPIVKFEWMDELFGDHFNDYHRLIPPLSGNTGEDIRGAVKSAVDDGGRDVESLPFDPDPPRDAPRATSKSAGLSLKDLEEKDEMEDRSRRDRDRDRGGRGRDRRSSYEEFAESDKPRDRDRDRDRSRRRGDRGRVRSAFDDRDDRDDRYRGRDRGGRGGRGRGISLDDLD